MWYLPDEEEKCNHKNYRNRQTRQYQYYNYRHFFKLKIKHINKIKQFILINKIKKTNKRFIFEIYSLNERNFIVDYKVFFGNIMLNYIEII